MKTKKGLLITTVVFAVVMIAAYWLYTTLSEQAPADPLIPTPTTAVSDTTATASPTRPFAEDFTMYDTDGNAVTLSAFRGKPVVLNFWASWCGPCKQEMPAFEEAFTRYGDEISFLMVNVTDGYQETKARADSFLRTTDYTFPVYYDLDQQGATAYAISSIPATFFIDAEGHLAATARGALSAKVLQSGIDILL